MQRFAELEKQLAPKAWAPQNGFTLDTAVKHAGNRSLLAENRVAATWSGARQAIVFNPPRCEPILVGGFSKAEGVSGVRDNQYSIYVDVCYASGAYLFGQCATFSPGTHDWEPSQYVIRPSEPVVELRVYCLLRNREGKAWFDDIHVGPVDRQEVSGPKRPGAEH